MIKQLVTSLVFLRQNNDVLLAMKKRGFGQGRWNGIGGKIDGGETIEQGMVRETQEEIAVTPTSYEKVGELHFDEYFKGESTHVHVHVFIADEWKGTPEETEEMKPQWFAISDIPYDIMWPDDTYWLPLVMGGKKISANFKLDEHDNIISHTVTEVGDFTD